MGSRTAELTIEHAGGLQWYALRTPAQKEFVAQEILGRRGITTFLPVERKWRRRNKYTKQKELRSYPLLVRYIFAGFVPGIPLWFNIFNIPTITGCVGLNGEPKELDNAAVCRFIGKYPNGLQRPDEEQYMQTGKEFTIGEHVRISDGPFEGIVVPVVNILGKDAELFVELFGGRHKVRIRMDKLEAA